MSRRSASRTVERRVVRSELLVSLTVDWRAIRSELLVSLHSTVREILDTQIVVRSSSAATYASNAGVARWRSASNNRTDSIVLSIPEEAVNAVMQESTPASTSFIALL